MSKYSYMPTNDSYGKSTVTEEMQKGYLYWIDSDERQLTFRNQYGETFLLAPYKAIAASWFVWMILGILIGRFVL